MATPFLVLFSARRSLSLIYPLRQRLLFLEDHILALAARTFRFLLLFLHPEGTAAVIASILLTMHFLPPPRSDYQNTVEHRECWKGGSRNPLFHRFPILPLLPGTYSFLPQESFPPGFIQVLTPSLGNTYLFRTNQAAMIAISTRISFIATPSSLPVPLSPSHILYHFSCPQE